MEVDLAGKRIKNLSVLQNVLSEGYSNKNGNAILEIVEEATHVALYMYDTNNSKW